MFDSLNSIFAGFSGKLAGLVKARKLVWLLMAAFAAGLACTAFLCWLSQPTYFALVDGLGGAALISWTAAGFVAIVVYFTASYFTGWLVEGWLKVPEMERNYEKVGASIAVVCLILFSALDLYMQVQGAHYRAKEVAGADVRYQYETPPERRGAMDKDRNTLADLTTGRIGGYGWKDEKTGIFHLNKSGKAYANDLRRSINAANIADSTDRAQAIADKDGANGEKGDRYARAEQTLSGAAWGVYAIIALLCTLQAYCVERIQSDMRRAGLLPAVEVHTHSVHTDHVHTDHVGTQSVVRNAGGANPVRATGGASVPLNSAGGVGGVGVGGTKSCENCNTDFVVRSVTHRFCSDACRIEANEKRTGLRLNLSGKTKKAARIGY